MSNSKNTYRLINPYIEGSMNTLVNAKNSFSAGKHLYNTISKFFTNHVEGFNIAIQNISSKDITHFRISERRGSQDSNAVDFDMVKLPEETLPKEINDKLLTKIDKMDKQVGGGKHRKHDSDSTTSSSSSSDDDYYYRNNAYVQPITRFTYFNLPYMYNTKFIGLNAYDYNSLFMPVFSWPISPVVEIKMDFFR